MNHIWKQMSSKLSSERLLGAQSGGLGVRAIRSRPSCKPGGSRGRCDQAAGQRSFTELPSDHLLLRISRSSGRSETLREERGWRRSSVLTSPKRCKMTDLTEQKRKEY